MNSQDINIKLIQLTSETLYKQLSAIEGEIIRLVIFDHAADSESYLSQRSAIGSALSSALGDRLPAWSYIAQRPLTTPTTIEVWSRPRQWSVEYKLYNELPYTIATCGEKRELSLGGISSSAATIHEQATEINATIEAIMERERMPISAIARQWNYIERITHTEGGVQHYQEFNDARSELYDRVLWHEGYPAATGIGSSCGGLVVDLIATEGMAIKAIDNELQIAAHAYSKQVLIGENDGRTTPKFERAKLCDELLYVSGTAAIRGELSLIDISAAEQTKITLENIDTLLQNANCQQVESLRVYIKNIADTEAIQSVVEAYAPNRSVYLHADICRTELLVEIEAIAKTH